MAALEPWPSDRPIGVIFRLLRLVGLAYEIMVVRMQRRLDFISLDWSDWIPYAGVPALGNLSLIAGGAGLTAECSFAPYAIAGASTLFLIVGIYGAWDLTLWILKNRHAP